MTVRVVEVIGLVLGVLLCSPPLLFYGAPSPPPAITAMGLAIAALGLALVRPDIRWQTGGGVGLAYVVVVGVRIIVDIVQDPTSHNLWPFDVVFASVIGLSPAALGVVVGRRIRRSVPWPAGGAATLIALALASALVSATSTAAEMTRLEAIAVRKVAALVAAERRFRAAQPQRGYTCNLSELGEPLSGPVASHRQNYRLNGVVYRGGTAVIENEYRYSLMCPGERDPQDSFVLTARSLVEQGDTRPLHIFCAGGDSVIRSIRSRRLYTCFVEGQIVETAN